VAASSPGNRILSWDFGDIVASSLVERELLLDSLNLLKRWRMVEGGDLDSDSAEIDVLEETALPREKKPLVLELLSLAGDIGGGDEPYGSISNGIGRCHVGSRGSE